MKLLNVVPLAALASAFIIPPEQVLDELRIEDHHKGSWVKEAASAKDELVSSLDEYIVDVSDKAKNAWNRMSKSSQDKYVDAKDKFDDIFDYASHEASTLGEKFEGSVDDLEAFLDESELFSGSEGDPHHGPPHHGPPHDGPPKHGPPHHKKPCHKPNETVYQLIAGSKYTTKLAKLINEYPDLVETLNSTKANYTVFAPTNKAFEKIPDHAPKPTKEQLLKVLQYHVVSDFYPAFRVLATHTAPTLLIGDHLSSQAEQQRVSFNLLPTGLFVNRYSRVVAINIFGTNGVIHGVDSLLIPPPKVITIIDLFPTAFSTLELGLGKTGLLEKLNTTKHNGGTFFAPNNWAFTKLGPKINAFLFSQYGQKYLKALLEYHVVPDNTLYSDAYYKAESSSMEVQNFPKGHFHVELPTLLEDRSLSVDIARFGGWITVKVNGFASVGVQDVIAEDGVIQVVRSVLIPPKKLGGMEIEYDEGELTVEELKERLEPYVAKSQKSDL